MPTFTVLSVSEPKPWQGKYGEMIDYEITVDGDQGRGGPVTLTQKPSTPAPSSGMELDGALVEERGRWKFKKTPPAEAPNGSGSTGGGRYGKSPAESAEIRRMHSQEMSLRLVEIELARGVLSESEAKTTELIEKRANWFDADAKAAGERA